MWEGVSREQDGLARSAEGGIHSVQVCPRQKAGVEEEVGPSAPVQALHFRLLCDIVRVVRT